MPNVSKALELDELKLSGHGRVFLRASGKAPMIRIFVEGEIRRKINQITIYLADAVREESSRTKA